MKTPAALLAALLAGATALAAPDKEALKREVAALEDRFCTMAREQGVLAAFEHFAAPEVAFIDTDPRRYRGVEAVRRRMEGFPAGGRLTWSAAFTDVSDDGTLAYNYGRYELVVPATAGGEERRSGGWFLSIWKRQPDGSWRYVMDTGVPDRPAAP